MKKFLKVFAGAILFILLASLCAGIVLGWRIWQVHKLARGEFELKPSSIHLQPPTPALSAYVVDRVIGTVQKIPRDQDEPVDLSLSDKVFQGETVTTGAKSETELQFGGKILVSLEANTQLGFSDTLPEEFLVSHQGGTAIYQTQETLAVRSLHTLFQIKEGTARITMENSKRLTLEVLDGQTTIAFVDKQNNTKTWVVMTGQKALINDDARTVTVR
jgi:hypothetical protein